MNQPEDLVLQPTELNHQVAAEKPAQEFEFLRVEVSRKEYTTVYMKVPKGWRPSGRNYKVMQEVVEQTTERGDWDNYGLEDGVEVESYKTCPASEASFYPVYQVPC